MKVHQLLENKNFNLYSFSNTQMYEHHLKRFFDIRTKIKNFKAQEIEIIFLLSLRFRTSLLLWKIIKINKYVIALF